MALCSENMGFLPLGCGGGGSQDWFVNSLMGFEDDGGGFNLQEQHQAACQALQNQRNQSIGFDRHQGAPGVCEISPLAASQSLPALFEKQRLEIDWVLHLQSESLKSVLREHRKRQVASLVQRYESRFASMICQKEEEIAMASKKTMELEECLRKTELEKQTWQRKANENEAIVTHLHNTLSQVRKRIAFSDSPEAESFCGSCTNQQHEEEVASSQIKMICKLCNVGFSSVVFLPCRHLCCCKTCEGFLGFCPVCESLKEASMEVFLA